MNDHSLLVAYRSILALAAVLALAMPPSQAAAEAPTAIFVVDGSGSMWGKLDGDRRSRFVATRDTLRQSFLKVDGSVRLGLLSFGHRRAGDCEDVELLIGPEPETAESIGNVLARLNPRGRGPISLALREASETLAGTSGPASIVLIHDDLDNCRADPCAATAEIRKAIPKLKVHVVSIGMKREDFQRMACVAKETGGRHFDVQVSAQLVSAIEETVKLATQVAATAPSGEVAAKLAAPARLAEAQARPAMAEPGLLLAVKLSAKAAAVVLPVHWRVRKEGDSTASALYEGVDPGPKLPLAPGRYAVRLKAGTVVRNETFTVAAGAPVDATMVLEAGAVMVKAVAQKGGAPAEGVHFVVQGADGSPVQMTTDPLLVLPPGEYTVTAIKGQGRVSRRIRVQAGSVEALELALAIGHLSLSLVTREGGRAVGDALFVLYEDDPDAPQGRREIARTASPEPNFALPVGTYYIVARHGGAEVRDRVVLKVGERLEKTLVAGSGRLAIATRIAGGQLPEDLISYRIERLDGQSTAETILISRPTAELDLATGRYRIAARLGILNAVAMREIEVRVGANPPLTLELQAGLLRLRLLEKAGGAVLPDAFWEISDGAGRVVWSTGQAEPRAALRAGRYSVKAERRDRRGEASVEVRSGEERTLDVVLK